MKGNWLRRSSAMAAIILLMGLSSTAVVAQDSSETSQGAQETLLDRLAARKEQLKTRLTAAQQNQLKARCKAAQTVLTNVSERLTTAEKNRVNAYDKIVDHLNMLVTKVGTKADTTKLKSEIETLQTKIEAFENDVLAYKQIISDMREMDCIGDPTGFKASLETARVTLTGLKEKAADIRAFILNTIKPTIQEIRVDLQNNQGQVVN